MTNDSLKERTASGLLWGMLNQGSMQVMNLVFGILLGRLLTQADYGLIGMLMVFTQIAASLQDSGFAVALTNKRDATHLDYNSVFWFNVAVSLLLYVALFLGAPLIADFYREPLLTPLARYLFFGFVVASFSIVPRNLLFRQLRQKELALMAFVSLLVSGCVGVGMAWAGMAYWGLATQTLTFNLCVSLLSWRLSGWRPSRRVSLRPIREMLGFSSKMLATNIFNHLNANLFSMVFGRAYGKSVTGYYTQANKWNTMCYQFVSGMVQGVAQPTFVQMGDDPERLRRAFRKMLRYTAFIAFPLLFGLALVAPEFITLTIGPKWLPSAGLMQVLCLGGAATPLATLYANFIISRGRSNVYLWNVVSQGLLLLGLVWATRHTPLAQVLHAWGLPLSRTPVEVMVWGYSLLLYLWLGVWHFFVWREIRLSPWSALADVLPYLGCAALVMGFTYWATLPIASLYLLLPARVALAAVLYVGLLWVSGAHTLREALEYAQGKFHTKARRH